MSSKHTMLSTLVVNLDDVEMEFDACITFIYHPGSPAYTPRGEYAPVDPPEPEMVEGIDIQIDTAKPGKEACWMRLPEWLEARFAGDEQFQGEKTWQAPTLSEKPPARGRKQMRSGISTSCGCASWRPA